MKIKRRPHGLLERARRASMGDAHGKLCTVDDMTLSLIPRRLITRSTASAGALLLSDMHPWRRAG